MATIGTPNGALVQRGVNVPESTSTSDGAGQLPGAEGQPARGRDAWYTADELVSLGYRREALEELFGTPTHGPDELTGWTAASVAKIEQSQLAPAFDLLEMAFGNKELVDAADIMRVRVSFDQL